MLNRVYRVGFTNGEVSAVSLMMSAVGCATSWRKKLRRRAERRAQHDSLRHLCPDEQNHVLAHQYRVHVPTLHAARCTKTSQEANNNKEPRNEGHENASQRFLVKPVHFRAAAKKKKGHKQKKTDHDQKHVDSWHIFSQNFHEQARTMEATSLLHHSSVAITTKRRRVTGD